MVAACPVIGCPVAHSLSDVEMATILPRLSGTLLEFHNALHRTLGRGLVLKTTLVTVVSVITDMSSSVSLQLRASLNPPKWVLALKN